MSLLLSASLRLSLQEYMEVSFSLLDSSSRTSSGRSWSFAEYKEPMPHKRAGDWYLLSTNFLVKTRVKKPQFPITSYPPRTWTLLVLSSIQLWISLRILSGMCTCNSVYFSLRKQTEASKPIPMSPIFTPSVMSHFCFPSRQILSNNLMHIRLHSLTPVHPNPLQPGSRPQSLKMPFVRGATTSLVPEPMDKDTLFSPYWDI